MPSRSRTPLVPVALLLLPLACTGRPKGDSPTDSATESAGTTDTTPMGTTGTPTTGQPPQPTTTSGPDATTGPATSDAATDPATDASTSDPVTSTTSTDATSDASSTTLAPPESECDIWTQDCPEGQKCMPVSLDDMFGNEAARCRPVVDDPDTLGEQCTVLGTSAEGLDTCPEGQFCWRSNHAINLGTCLALCAGSPQDPTCAEPGLECVLHPLGVENLCIRHCDPLAQDCPGDDLCVPDHVGLGDGAFMCINDASGDEGQLFDPCTELNTCDAGLECASSFKIVQCGVDPDERCCLPYCDLTVDPDPCLDIDLECLEAQWDPPPGLEDVGVCGVAPI